MDIQMPDIDGMETTRRLRQGEGPNAEGPIIALTANVLEEQKVAYLAAGMNGVAPKPLAPVVLLQEIARVCGDEAQAA